MNANAKISKLWQKVLNDEIKRMFVAEWSIGNRYAVCFVTVTVLSNHTNVCMYQIYA